MNHAGPSTGGQRACTREPQNKVPACLSRGSDYSDSCQEWPANNSEPIFLPFCWFLSLSLSPLLCSPLLQIRKLTLKGKVKGWRMPPCYCTVAGTAHSHFWLTAGSVYFQVHFWPVPLCRSTFITDATQRFFCALSS